MKINPFKILVSVLLAGFLFASCSSDDDSKPAPVNTPKTNSYSLTIDGQLYANSWEAGQTPVGTSLWSTYMINDAGSEIMTLGITEVETELIVDAGLHIENNQAFPLGDISVDDWDEDLDFSFILIYVGDIDYQSYSGSAVISNLKRDPFLGVFGGNASYDLVINGIFRKFDPSLPYLEPEEQEQVTITGIVHIGTNQ